ncbi:hypothetical protein LSP03_15420 [Lysinibacillus sphaericus]|nr:hypothetical protein LSP03_15420 [Lysinibacillus sphaericus]
MSIKARSYRLSKIEDAVYLFSYHLDERYLFNIKRTCFENQNMFFSYGQTHINTLLAVGIILVKVGVLF